MQREDARRVAEEILLRTDRSEQPGGIIDRRLQFVIERTGIVDGERGRARRNDDAQKRRYRFLVRYALYAGARCAEETGLHVLAEVETAELERQFALAQRGQTGGIRLRGRGVIGRAEERASHAERTRSGIGKIELQTAVHGSEIEACRQEGGSDECREQSRPAEPCRHGTPLPFAEEYGRHSILGFTIAVRH